MANQFGAWNYTLKKEPIAPSKDADENAAVVWQTVLFIGIEGWRYIRMYAPAGFSKSDVDHMLHSLGQENKILIEADAMRHLKEMPEAWIAHIGKYMLAQTAYILDLRTAVVEAPLIPRRPRGKMAGLARRVK